MPKIFISYRREDSAYIADTICEKLEKRFGTDSVFFDIDSIPLGSDFRKHIPNSVGKCDVLLAVIGDTWIDAVDSKGNRRIDNPADFVRVELESALERDIPVIPVLVGEARIPSETVLSSSLQDLTFRNAAEVRAGRDLQEHLSRLVRGVDSLLPLERQESTHKDHETRQSRRRESNLEKAATLSTNLSTAQPRERRPSQPVLKRWVFSSVVFILFFIAGVAAGSVAANYWGDEAGFIVGLPTWLVGIALAYRVWKLNYHT